MRSFVPCWAALIFALTLSACGWWGDDATSGGAEVGPLGSAVSPGGVVRRVWEGTEPDFWAAEPSPDGRYISEIDWTTGDLAVIDLLTGEVIRITDKGTWEERGSQWAETSVFSPDGQRLAFTYFNDTGYDIRVIDVDGSNERTILEASALDGYPMLRAWRGDRLLTELSRSERDATPAEFIFVSVSDGSIRQIKRLDRIVEGANPVLSVDGRHLAYSFLASESRHDFDVVVISTGDGRELSRFDGPSSDRALGWAADGRSLLFHSDRELMEGVWSQPMEDGRSAGPPTLIRGGLWGLEPIGSSRGEYFFGVTTESPRVHVAPFDPETGTFLAGPTPVTQSSRIEQNPVWSPDGGYLASIYTAGPGGEPTPATLVIRSLEGDPVRQIGLPVKRVRLLAWTSEETLLAEAEDPATGEDALYRIMLETGTLAVAASEAAVPGLMKNLVVSSDASTAYFARPAGDSRWAITARDVTSGREVRLYESIQGSVQGIYPSPDGELVALRFLRSADLTHVLALVSTDGGSLRELYAAPIETTEFGVVWAPDSGHLFFATRDPRTRTYTRWKADVTGEVTPVLQHHEPDGLGPIGAVLHPDGRRIAFTSGTLRGEIWMMRSPTRGGSVSPRPGP